MYDFGVTLGAVVRGKIKSRVARRPMLLVYGDGVFKKCTDQSLRVYVEKGWVGRHKGGSNADSRDGLLVVLIGVCAVASG